MNKNVSELLNQQINAELFSAYLYLHYANYFESKGLDGFANWYTVQAQEERDHAMLFYRFMHNSGEKITLEAIDKPAGNFKDLIAPLEAGLGHEKYITARINKIYLEAQKANEFHVLQFLDWFIKEQVEEIGRAHV